MAEKLKKQDRQLWERMGRELYFLERLIGDVYCDADYNEMVDKRTWDHLSKAYRAVSELRARCEDRAFHVCSTMDNHVFYGLGDIIKRPLDDVRGLLDNNEHD